MGVWNENPVQKSFESGGVMVVVTLVVVCGVVVRGVAMFLVAMFLVTVGGVMIVLVLGGGVGESGRPQWCVPPEK